MRKVIALAVSMVAFSACAGQPDELTPVTLMLDWVPNTNHTGFFVAQSEGYFENVGLAVEIVQPDGLEVTIDLGR